jgi:hypothetical protein
MPSEQPPSRRQRRPPQPVPAGAVTATLKDAAVTVGLSPLTLRRRAADGHLRLLKVAGRTLVDVASLRAMVGLVP